MGKRWSDCHGRLVRFSRIRAASIGVLGPRAQGSSLFHLPWMAAARITLKSKRRRAISQHVLVCSPEGRQQAAVLRKMSPLWARSARCSFSRAWGSACQKQQLVTQVTSFVSDHRHPENDGENPPAIPQRPLRPVAPVSPGRSYLFCGTRAVFQD